MSPSFKGTKRQRGIFMDTPMNPFSGIRSVGGRRREGRGKTLFLFWWCFLLGWGRNRNGRRNGRGNNIGTRGVRFVIQRKNIVSTDTWYRCTYVVQKHSEKRKRKIRRFASSCCTEAATRSQVRTRVR